MTEEQKKLGLNIQLFADEGNDDGANQSGHTDTEPKEPVKPAPTFEEMLLQEDYQSQFDKRLGKALETARGKWEADYKAKLEAEKTEAERLAKLSEAERVKEQMAEKDKQIAELTARENARTLKDETIKIFTQKEIPISYIDLFDFNNMTAQAVNEKVELLSTNLSKDKENWLNSSLKQKTPTSKGTDNKDTKPKTYEDFLKEEQN